MDLKLKSIDEKRFLGQIKKNLQKIAKDYVDDAKAVEIDIDNLHEIALNNYTYLFQRTLTEALKIKKAATLIELSKNIESLTSRNYKLNKEIKAKKEELLNEQNKEKFFALKNEILDLVKSKAHFSLLEKNFIKYKLMLELRDYVDRLEHLNYSGDKVLKEDVSKIVKEGNDIILKILDTKQPIKHETSNIMKNIKEKLLGSEHDDSKERLAKLKMQPNSSIAQPTPKIKPTTPIKQQSSQEIAHRLQEAKLKENLAQPPKITKTDEIKPDISIEKTKEQTINKPQAQDTLNVPKLEEIKSNVPFKKPEEQITKPNIKPDVKEYYQPPKQAKIKKEKKQSEAKPKKKSEFEDSFSEISKMFEDIKKEI